MAPAAGAAPAYYLLNLLNLERGGVQCSAVEANGFSVFQCSGGQWSAVSRRLSVIYAVIEQ